jgi:hypothetical protein
LLQAHPSDVHIPDLENVVSYFYAIVLINNTSREDHVDHHLSAADAQVESRFTTFVNLEVNYLQLGPFRVQTSIYP